MCGDRDMNVRKNAVLNIRKIRKENQTMEKSIERSDKEEDSAPAIDEDLLN